MLPIAMLILALRQLSKRTYYYYAEGEGQAAGGAAFVAVIVVFGVTLLQALLSTIVAAWVGKRRWMWNIPVSIAPTHESFCCSS